MGDLEIEALRRFFAALSNEERLSIAGRLVERDATAHELAQLLGIQHRIVARHLAMLVDHGIVTMTQAGPPVRYALDVRSLRDRRASLLQREPSDGLTHDVSASDDDRAVLSRFLDGETLKEIPTKLNKRMVVLAWLAERFDPTTSYPERAVNEVIKRHHPDASALRRELVDHGFMARENGVYRRLPRWAA